MNGEPQQGILTTAELASSANTSAPVVHDPGLPVVQPLSVDRTTHPRADDTKLVTLFSKDAADDFRSRWDIIQKSFVDDPKESVRAGDELVAQVIKSLTESFSSQQGELEAGLNQTERASTENLRVALRRYRSFFERLLAI
jgi:hypothetical protein